MDYCQTHATTSTIRPVAEDSTGLGASTVATQVSLPLSRQCGTASTPPFVLALASKTAPTLPQPALLTFKRGVKEDRIA